jgi:lipocalin-like protein
MGTIFALFLIVSFASMAQADDDTKQKLPGVWKLESLVVESAETKERNDVFGKNPNGYLVITPERFTAILTGQDRSQRGPMKNDRSCCNRCLHTQAPTPLRGTRLTTKVDVSWNESWTGTDQVRIFRLEGDTLFFETLLAPAPNQTAPGLVKGILSFSRSK